MQIPVNIFDRTQIESGGLQALVDAGMMVFVRSVYLQGLVFRNHDTLPGHMAFCREPLATFHSLCKKYALSPALLAISYVLSLPGITSLVLGSETVAQVEDNIRLLDSVPTLTDEQLAEIRDAFLTVDPRLINPSAWGNA